METPSTLPTNVGHSGIRSIVVGLDDSPESFAALDWAVALASGSEAEIVVVQAWQKPTVSMLAAIVAGRDAAELALAETVEQVDTAGVTVTTRYLEGSAASVLVEASKAADLLVVGSRGRGGFTGLLLGSVSTQCVHHAHCPVVVIPRQQATQPD